MGRLTDSQLQAWVRKGEPVRGRSDGHGLTFSISATGTATWELRYRTGARQKWLTLGGYPALSLREARVKAMKERTRIFDGIDPVAERKRERVARAMTQTFKALAEDYLAKKEGIFVASFLSGFRRYLQKDVYPAIGSMRLDEITGAEIVYVVEQVARRSPTGARAVFSRMSVIFDHGVGRHVVRSNPCGGLKPSAIIGDVRPKRERLQLTRDELHAVVAEAPKLNPVYGLVVKIMLATCVRRSEMVKARVSDIDLDAATWTIPQENSKNKKAFVIPLAPLVVGWFRDLIALGHESPWVVPGMDRSRHLTPESLNKIVGSLRERLGDRVRSFTPHDLRSTARSYLSELGVDVATAEMCLNHSLGGLVAIYDQSDRINQRRQALAVWSDFLRAIEDGKDWKVTTLFGAIAA